MTRGVIETARRLYELGQLPLAGARRPNRQGEWKRPKTEIAEFYNGRPSWDVLAANLDDDGQLLWGFGRWDAALPDGRTGRCFALDIDGPNGVQWVLNACQDPLMALAFNDTVKSITHRGLHYFFIDPSGEMRGMPNKANLVPELDIRINGGYVLCSPSRYLDPDTDHVSYEWADENHDLWGGIIQTAPTALVEMLLELNNRGKVRPLRRGSRVVETELADHPEGTRNETLIRYAGDLLSDNRHDLDGFYTAVTEQGLRMGLDEAEVQKTARSAVDMDRRNHPELWTDQGESRFAPQNGWLCSDGGIICAPVKDKETQTIWPQPWATFDFRVTGRVMDHAGTGVDAYEGTLARIGGTTLSKILITVNDLARKDRFYKWLAQYQLGVHPPRGDDGRGYMPDGSRLSLYLGAQPAPEIQYVDHYGWDDVGGWLSPDGEITPDGLKAFGKRRPHPILAELARYAYGFEGDRSDVKEILRELLTFHHRAEAAVFASWVTAVIVKHNIMENTSVFPFMAIEAPAETGKTEGMFSRMLQLSGYSATGGITTPASFRNFVSQHRNGVVWIDDPDDPEKYHEILRQATGERSLTKMADDNIHTVTFTMQAAIAMSGESLGLASQKALIDRRIFLEPRSPVERKSLKDTSVPQWVDVKIFDARWKDLTARAGWFVAEVLREAPRWTPHLRDLRAAAEGRAGDALAVVRVGARILASVSGEGWVVDQVDHWVDEQTGRSVENRLTLEILPSLIARYGLPDHATRTPPSAQGRDLGLGVFPAYQDELGVLWVNYKSAASWWAHASRSRVLIRVDSEAALLGQIRDVADMSRQVERPRVDGSDKDRPRMWPIRQDITDGILARAAGQTYPGDTGGTGILSQHGML